MRVQLDIVAAGNCHVNGLIYPVGFRWSKSMKAHVGTDLCMQAHVGFWPAARSTWNWPTAAYWNVARHRSSASNPVTTARQLASSRLCWGVIKSASQAAQAASSCCTLLQYCSQPWLARTTRSASILLRFSSFHQAPEIFSRFCMI